MKNQKNSDLVEAPKMEVSKPGNLSDSLYEDILHADFMSRKGHPEDISLRVTPVFSKKAKQSKLIVSGAPHAQATLKQLLQGKKFEIETNSIETYPDSPGFDPVAFKKVAAPQLARTLQTLRKRLGTPLDAFENITASIEQDVQDKLAWLIPSAPGLNATEVKKKAPAKG